MAALAVVLVVQFACNEARSRRHSASRGDYSKLACRSMSKNAASFYDRCSVLVVSTGGTPQYTSIQDVLDRLPKFTTKRVTIDVGSGIYKEKDVVIIPATRPYLSLRGEGRRRTIITWHTLMSMQAVAIRTSWDNASLLRCNFFCHQDASLFDTQGRHYYFRCFIQGSEGFVFAGARSLFERFCWLHAIAPVVLLHVEEEKVMSKRFKKICVFCGTSSVKNDVLSNEALNLGRESVNRRIHLVYGGGNIGLIMSQLAQIVKSGGGHVIGVILKAIMDAELTGSTVEEPVAVTGMHQRKAEMTCQADAFIALPGPLQAYLKFDGRRGYGTREELVEVVTWNQLGLHKKLVGLLNVGGSCDTPLAFFDKHLEEEFFDNSARSIVVSAPTASKLLDKLEAYAPIANGPKL